jgi:phosphopantetheinyl transferase
LTLAERARLAGFRVPKRRDDWLIGRIAAKSVVAAALADALPGDWPPCAIEIPSDSTGMPYARLAPEADPVAGFAPGARLPVSVSISHAEGHALCAATWSAPGDDGSRSLGVDLGPIEPRSRAFVATFLTEDEQRFVLDGLPSERGLRANLVWGAKEAVLKALGLGLTVDTLDLCCLPEAGSVDPAEWPLAPPDDGWRPFVARCSPALFAGGGDLRGIWRTLPGFVGALACAHELVLFGGEATKVSPTPPPPSRGGSSRPSPA